MANNRIPRNAKKIYITWKVDTSATRTGDRDTVEKIDNKWIGTSATGATYSMPVSILRNANVVQVDQIETDEPNNRKDVLLSDIGTQVYIIDGASRTDKAAQAVIAALCNNGRITGELAERARNDRPTLDKIKRNLLHVQMEERETETGMRWTFYTASGVYMDISAYSRNYIRADKHGNLYPTEAPTEPETIEGKEDTTTAKTEPQEGTETAQKTTDMETFKKAYSAAYTALYDHCGEPETDEKERYYCALFDQEAEAIADTVRRFCAYRGDLVSSDREAAAFMIALEAVGTPTDGKTVTDGETTTITETKPQRATETPRKTIRTGERLYSHPHRHMVTVEGLQGDLVRVIYKGRLYLVCSSDLYTDESETTPAMLPQAAENAGTAAGDTTPTEGTQEGTQTAGTSEGAQTTTPPHTEPPRAATGGSVSQSDRRTRPAAPQSHETTKGIQRHHRPPKTAYRATQRAAADHRRRVAASRGSPKIRIFWE